MSRPVRSLGQLNKALLACDRCPRLVAWRTQVAREKRRAYRAETYWGRPVPGFGDPRAPLILVGLAPGAHGANRTGRMFTGDRSGDFLYAALHRAGLASQPESKSRSDGLVLSGAAVTAPVRCAPPDNKPTVTEIAACRPWMAEELALLDQARVFLALGRIAFEALTRGLSRTPRSRLRSSFHHGARMEIPHPRGGDAPATLFASYHVSQQNTQTGRLTEAMFDEVLVAARDAAGIDTAAA